MEKIIFENSPSTNTPINANNLNQLQTNVENAINGVIESGTNENGSWIKFDDGTMICRNNVVLNNLTFAKPTSSSIVAQTTDGNNLGDYPQTFVEVQTLFVDCITTPFMKPLDVYNRSNSHVGNCYLWTWNELSGASGTITYLAIGRWK